MRLVVPTVIKPSRRLVFSVFIGLLFVAAGVGLFIINTAEAARFSYRSMYINSARAGETTFYTVTLAYPSPAPVGSLRIQFCDNPIPSLPCNVPAGLDVSGANLTTQSGTTTGFTITSQTQNELILSRAPQVPGGDNTSYRFDNVVNPSSEDQDFYARITSHGSVDASGAIIDYGSVSATTTPEIGIYTQVPPVIIFCVGEQINDDECTDIEGNYRSFGELRPDQTYYAASEILFRTNAQYGLTILVNGTTMTSGIKTIPPLETPTQSFQGVSQFGMNLTQNSTIGANPTGPGANAILNPDYTVADTFLFRNNDIIVTTNEVTVTQKVTASYVVNVSAEQAPGVYSTTVSYVCLASF